MKNSTFILELLEAIQLAKSLVIIKVHGCSIDNFEEREGNYLALVAATSVTLQQSQSILEAPGTTYMGDWRSKRLVTGTTRHCLTKRNG